MILSIIIPVYNVEKYLKECIESVIKLNDKEIEIILVNDGSTDSSLFICNSYSIKDSRIKVINKDNGGLSDARNFGIRQACGKYIMFLDSDDYIKINSLINIINILKKNDIDVMMNSYVEITEGKELNILGINSKLKEKLYTVDNELVRNIFKYTIGIWPAWKFIVSKKFLIESCIEFKKGYLHEDVDFTTKILVNMNSFYYNPRVLYCYRISREGSIVNNKKFKSLKDTIDIVLELEAYINSKQINDKLKYEINKCLSRAVFCNLHVFNFGNEMERDEIIKNLENNKKTIFSSTRFKHRLFSWLCKIIGIKNSILIYNFIK